jgi:hypothetical protein
MTAPIASAQPDLNAVIQGTRQGGRFPAARVTADLLIGQPKGQTAPCAVTLTERDVEMFARIGVPLDLAEAARIERVTNQDAREKFGLQGPASMDMAGIVFPYYSHATGRRVTARVRRDNPEMEGGKPKGKYIAPYGDSRQWKHSQ